MIFFETSNFSTFKLIIWKLFEDEDAMDGSPLDSRKVVRNDAEKSVFAVQSSRKVCHNKVSNFLFQILVYISYS